MLSNVSGYCSGVIGSDIVGSMCSGADSRRVVLEIDNPRLELNHTHDEFGVGVVVCGIRDSFGFG